MKGARPRRASSAGSTSRSARPQAARARSTGVVVGGATVRVRPDSLDRVVGDRRMLGAADVASVLGLQRTAGNVAVGTLLQRQDDEATPLEDPDAETVSGPLSDEQVAAAIDYYVKQPWLYTPAIINQIRTALGLEDGGIDAALAQAVATWQTETPTPGTTGPNPVSAGVELTIDGKAGPRTLPRLFARGLNTEASVDAYVDAAETEVADAWTALGTPEARADKLIELVNARLTDAGVPTVARGRTSLSAGVSGQFDPATWSIAVNMELMGHASLSTEEAADTFDTMYHEARHCEQWFRMAQLRANVNGSAGGLAGELAIARRAAVAAIAHPLVPGSMEAVIAQGWYDTWYGDYAAQTQAIEAEAVAAAGARARARAADARHSTPQTQAALVRANAWFDRAHLAYVRLSVENDAFATGGEVEDRVTRGTAEPAPAHVTPGGSPPGTAPRGEDDLTLDDIGPASDPVASGEAAGETDGDEEAAEDPALAEADSGPSSEVADAPPLDPSSRPEAEGPSAADGLGEVRSLLGAPG